MAHRKELSPFQHLGALHVADFGGDVFDAGRNDAEGRKEHRVTVARDHLGADRFGAQAQLFADMVFDGGVDIGKGADRAGNGTGGDFPAGLFQAVLVAVHFRIKARKGQAHCRGFGVNAVAAAHTYGHFVFQRALFQRRQQGIHIGQQYVGGAHQLHVQAGVKHIRRGHALMHEAGLVAAHMFGQMSEKGDDVVFGHGLDFINAGHVKFHVLGFPDGIGVLARDHTQIGHCIAGVRLDFIPDAELRGRLPDLNHVGAGITGDHGRAF